MPYFGRFFAMTFLKRNPFVGLVFGLVLVAVGLLGLPIMSGAADAGTPHAACRFASDGGYGLSGGQDGALCR